MPFNGSGTYSLPAGNPVVTGTTISSTTTNNTNSDIATALSNCVTRDGQSTPSANLPMNSKKLTGLAAGTTNGDSVRYDELQVLQNQVNGIAGAFSTLEIITSSGTFIIPTGKTVIKATVVGAGGGGAGTSGYGGDGGNTTLASGTQTITTLTGGGGFGGSPYSYTDGGAGGTATNGAINIKGSGGTGNGNNFGGSGGASSFGGGGQAAYFTGAGYAGGAYGGGGGGVGAPSGGSNGGSGGGGGGTAIKYLTGLVAGNTLMVTVGAGGAAGSGGAGGGAGAAGVVIFEY